MRRIAIFFLVLVFGINAQMVNAQAVSLEPTANEAVINAYAEEWAAAFAAGNIQALSDLYEPDVWIMPGDGHQKAMKGREAVLSTIAAFPGFGTDNVLDLKWEFEDLSVSGDYAFAVRTYKLTLALPGAEPVRGAGRSLVVFKRGMDGSWRVWRDMDNITPDVTVDGQAKH